MVNVVNGRDIMPMSDHAARSGHVILRVVLTVLSIAVLLACMLMWWVTTIDTPMPMATSPASTLQQQAAAGMNADVQG